MGGLDLSIYLRGSLNFHLVLCVSYSLSFLNLCCVCVSLILPLGLILAHCLLPPPTLASHAVAAHPPFFTTAKGLKTSSVVIILPTSLLTSGTMATVCRWLCRCAGRGCVVFLFLSHELLPVVCVLTCLWAGFSAGAYPDTPSVTYNIQTNKS